MEQGLIISDAPVLSAGAARNALVDFMSQPGSYRRRFLQKEYGYAFDGYSHHGQSDSTHQAADDLLHSFVFSDFYPQQRYPLEFQAYLNDDWTALTTTLRQVEITLLQTLPTWVRGQYESDFGHMMSANYYPPLAQFDTPASGHTRLSAHPDVSLLTVFPFGIDQHFQYRDSSGSWHSAPATDRMIAFPGYLMQWLSHGAIPALNHRVQLAADNAADRYSFAIFSLPRPGTSVYRESDCRSGEREYLAAEEYFSQYVSLWDY